MKWTTHRAHVEGYYDHVLGRVSAYDLLISMGESELAGSYQEGWDYAAQSIPEDSPFHREAR